MDFVTYDLATGEIDLNYSGTEAGAARQCSDGIGYVINEDGAVPDTHYVNLDTRQINKRPATPATPSKLQVEADGVDTLKLSQMRDGTTIRIDGPASGKTTVSGDNVTESFTFTTPGSYTFTITAPWPAVSKTIEVTAA